ncbi:carboxypeptidase-like regulatory domain-containing protein [Haloarchaeobius amylolyticus]|uniref:carboxypeptidase-like regulatory domain-containing protein n=1 Tax=Haloarchaeobius amylolyticus TaxID=1198296 RepID=UPI002270459D|nr:carboxypeptidase-like regulatory domain-containing protein [Haloarchaeobius amylolyticus]
MRLTAIVLGLVLLLAPLTGVAAADGSTPDVALRITVVSETGDPVGNANVTITYGDEQKTRETVSNGEVLFDVPEGADVGVEVDHPSLVRNHPTSLANVQDGDELTVKMYESASATLSVEDRDGAVADAKVTVKKSDQRPAATGTTGSDGAFETGEIEAGEYTVTIAKSGYYREQTTIVAGDSTTETVSIREGSVNVEFGVVDPYFNESRPLQASIAIDGVGTFQTDKNGNRTVSLGVNTEYPVTVTKDGYQSYSGTFTVGESAKTVTYELTREPALSLEPANTQVVVGQNLRVTVTDEYGEPAEGVDVRVDGSSKATTGADGGATVEITSAGEVELSAANGSVTSDVVTIEGVQPATDSSDGTTTADTTDQTTATTAPGTETTGEDGGGGGATPGFGIGVALVALLGSLLVLQKRG